MGTKRRRFSLLNSPVLALVAFTLVRDACCEIEDLVHNGDELSWRELPFNPWVFESSQLISQIAPEDYPVDCAAQAVPCIGSVDLSVDAHAVFCGNVTDGDVIVSGALRYPPYCLSSVINGNVVIKDNKFVHAMTGFW